MGTAQLVTGYAGVAHVSSADVGSMHAGIVGAGRYVFNRGNKFAYTLVSNNLVTIADGDLLNQGRHCRIRTNDTVNCTIENGLAGTKRNDIIVMRYSKDTSTAVESATLVVVKGVSGSTAVDPAYTSGNILNGDTVDDFPLYRVRLNGLSVEGIDTLFTVNKTLEEKVNAADVVDEIENYASLTSNGKIMDATLVKHIDQRVWRKLGKNKFCFGDLEIHTGSNIFTTNADGSVTANGTSGSAGIPSTVRYTSKHILKSGSYIFSGCPSGGSDSTYSMAISDETVGAKDYGSGVAYSLTSDSVVTVTISVALGYAINKTFYPQICYADAENPLVYERYAKSNLELTKESAAIASLPQTVDATATLSSSLATQTSVNLSFTYTIPTGFKIASVTPPTCSNGNADCALTVLSDSSFGAYMYNRSTTNAIPSGTSVMVRILCIKS